MLKLSPLVRQALMKHLPKALVARNRNEFSEIIYDELEENIYFKKDILLFFLKKHNIKTVTLEVYEDENNDIIQPPLVLNIEEVREVVNNGLLRELRQYELEIFGVGEDFVEANEDGIDAINLLRINTLFDLIVSHALMSNKIPSEDEKEMTSLENETFYLPLRIILDNKPCTFFIGDAKNFFMEQLNEIASHHLSLIMPFQKESTYYLNDEDEEVKQSYLVFEKEAHSEESYYQMCYYMIDKINEVVNKFNNSIPDNFIHTEIFFKEELDIFTKIVMIKDINVAKNIPIKKLLSTLNNNFIEYERDFFDDPLSDMAEEVMDYLDIKRQELDDIFKKEKILKEQGISFISDKRKKTNIIYNDEINDDEYDIEKKEYSNGYIMTSLDELYD
jgi:hypothetical protein